MKAFAPVSVMQFTVPSFFSGLSLKKIGSIFQVASERRALREVPDYVLRDIGLTRIDAEREAARPFWDLPADR